jgi:hypothetical protein
MRARIPETTSRPVPFDTPRAARDSSVRANLRQRRQRRLEEARMQALVRSLSVDASGPGRSG